ncbi:3-methyladenine DNA glycosylase AlkC [Alteromonadaceae bacterium Bs31]|nr:3-methyladenine DNA glycosylase AlkC [Alteromonadaceae bacterium Bs31]
MLSIPEAPSAIRKGFPLKNVLGEQALVCLARNLKTAHGEFTDKAFIDSTLPKLAPLEFKERGHCIAQAMKEYLPNNYSEALAIILKSLTPANTETEGLGLAVMFYLPHSCFIERYGLKHDYNAGIDPFDLSMKAQYEITRRFSAEFSIRPFLIQQQQRTLAVLRCWINDSDPHVRRLCSEGTRPRLPWAQRIPALVQDPSPILPLLEILKDDPVLYVRRSVANSLGDIAKDHPSLVFDTCERWLEGANKELKWIIRHALRNPAKKGVERSLELRMAAK